MMQTGMFTMHIGMAIQVGLLMVQIGMKLGGCARRDGRSYASWVRLEAGLSTTRRYPFCHPAPGHIISAVAAALCVAWLFELPFLLSSTLLSGLLYAVT